MTVGDTVKIKIWKRKLERVWISSTPWGWVRSSYSLWLKCILLALLYIGCNVKPPKDVHEKEQFKNLRQWVQEALGNANIAAQVSLTLWSLQMLHEPLLHSLKIFSHKFCSWKLLISKHASDSSSQISMCNHAPPIIINIIDQLWNFFNWPGILWFDFYVLLFILVLCYWE